MRSAILKAAIALLLMGGIQASAQQPAAPPATPPAYLTDTDADMKAVLDARIAALKTVLTLTPEQEPLWAPVEQEIRRSAQTSRTRDNARYEQAEPSDFLQALERIATVEEERSGGIRAFVAAFRPLAGKLSPEQMRRIPPFLGMIDAPWGEQSSSQLWIFED